MLAITDFPRPVIAEVHGIATAAGCQLVATCDLAIAADDARFATPGVNIGLFCSTPMVALSRAVAPKHAMEMLLTGEMIDAEEAGRIGLINRAVPAAELTDATMALARKIAAKSIQTLKFGKGAFYRQVDMDLKHAYDYAAHIMTENMQALDARGRHRRLPAKAQAGLAGLLSKPPFAPNSPELGYCRGASCSRQKSNMVPMSNRYPRWTTLDFLDFCHPRIRAIYALLERQARRPR